MGYRAARQQMTRIFAVEDGVAGTVDGVVVGSRCRPG